MTYFRMPTNHLSILLVCDMRRFKTKALFGQNQNWHAGIALKAIRHDISLYRSGVTCKQNERSLIAQVKYHAINCSIKPSSVKLLIDLNGQ